MSIGIQGEVFGMGGATPPATVAPSATQPPRSRASAGGNGRVAGGVLVALGALAALAVVMSTDQILPATSAHQAEIRVWLGARAAGLTALILLTFQVAIGLVLSHPTNKSTWRLSKRLFSWHEHAWVFTLAFVAVHMLSLVVDRFARVGVLGAIVPGMSEYRSVPVALGTLALYALIVTGLTARFTRLLPIGWWLKLHRLSLVVLALAWAHGLLAGTDTPGVGLIYGATFAIVLGAGAYRYWIVRAARPSFAASLEEGQSR